MTLSSIKISLISLVSAFALLGCANTAPTNPSTETKESTAQSIRQVMANQQQAWNSGNLTAFMQGYWQSDKLRFASGNSYRFGWQSTLDNYIKGYPDKATMGQLKFDIIDINQVSDDVAIVFGRWHLTRENDQPKGLYTLLFEKKNGQWLITQDHTSSAKN
ncbi:nuclear transport factor 2 family protein [Psychrobium sp. 1_MG-2023]|uniref:YybH family protein n=1 Tax=Psychrobium sp. 1_MG-2023 TaxID=3062624 RepID=UPI0027336FA7|nr:nuclear transport factor 2 family protein [Psychrobium sp. 1_MG-2023]MDP2560411.1 nuclear transport factor 2 family protein [Psychrobium sp. 1_MG-2023]